MTASTASALRNQWTNPSDMMSILLIIGGDIVQKAFSQGAGTFPVPVCFSFGCVAYAFISLFGILGDGRLLSPPDYPCKIINLKSGHTRNSENFVVGRLLRDMEAIESRWERTNRDEEAETTLGDYEVCISVFEALKNQNGATQFSMGKMHVVATVIILLQVALGLIPYILNRSWNSLLITLVGTLLVQWTGSIPQWTAEKLPNQQRSSEIYALTSGNDSREIMIIFGCGKCLDLESLATIQSPRSSRLWEKFSSLARPRLNHQGAALLPRQNTLQRKAKVLPIRSFRTFPLGFIITQVTCSGLSVLWVLLLVSSAAQTSSPEGWCFIGIGALGMLNNTWVAAQEVSPKMRNMPLDRIDQIRATNLMDGIMDLHSLYGYGRPLLRELFPGKLSREVMEWWNGSREEYEAAREREGRKPFIRSALPRTPHIDRFDLADKSVDMSTNQGDSDLFVASSTVKPGRDDDHSNTGDIAGSRELERNGLRAEFPQARVKWQARSPNWTL